MLGAVVKNHLGRNVMRNFVRNGSQGGHPGENLPFDIHNRTRLTFNFFWFSLTGIAAPFLIVMYQMKKKSIDLPLLLTVIVNYVIWCL